MNLFDSIRTNIAALAVLAFALLFTPQVAAQLAGDGWHSWRVPVVDSAPDICCYRWNRGRPGRKSCDLDRGHEGFSVRSDVQPQSDQLQIYARMDGDRIVALRALSASCPVSTTGAINDLGEIDVETSIEWIDRLVMPSPELAGDALAAIAFHDGDIARDVLVQHGRDNTDPELRSDAWFWLALSHAEDGEPAIRDAVRQDRDDDVRESAVFALSQLPEDRALTALTELVEDRSLDMDIREQALFWLAQSDSDAAFEYIDGLLSDN